GAPGDLDGAGLEHAEVVIVRHRSAHAAAGHRLGYHLKALGGLDVKRFEHEPLHPASHEFSGAVDVVDAAFDHVGPDVNLQVVGAVKRFPRPIGNLNRNRGRGLSHAAYSA